MNELETLAALFLCLTNAMQLYQIASMRKRGKNELKTILEMLQDYLDKT